MRIEKLRAAYDVEVRWVHFPLHPETPPEGRRLVAERAGLPAGEAREVVTERRFRDAVDFDWRRSRELGVTAVPTFVAGGRGVVGAQPYEVLERLVVEAGARRRSSC